MTHGITDLQLSLIIIGVLSVGGVWGYNVWQERKHRRAAQELFGTTRQDVLLEQSAEPDEAMDPSGTADTASAISGETPPLTMGGFPDERIEPVILAMQAEPSVSSRLQECEENEDGKFEPGPGRAAPSDEAREPGVPARECLPGDDLPVLDEEAIVRVARQAAVAEAASVAAPVAQMDVAADVAGGQVDAPVSGSTPAVDLVDPVIDCVVQIHAGEMISAPLLWAGQRQLFGRLAGRLSWIGLDENTGLWQRLHVHDPNSYQRLYAALQLADRQGPVAADDVALFCDGVRQLAAHYHAQAIVPVVSEVMTRARSLDAFCASVDWRLVMHLAARGAGGRGMSIDDIGQMAAVAGLQKSSSRGDGDLHALDPQGQTQFTLGLSAKAMTATTAAAGDEEAGEDIDRIVLTLDVPLVTDGVAAFDRMIHLAQVMAGRLDAVLVDDRGKPLSQEVLDMIRDRMGEFQLKMVEHQISPGSRRALRLYS